MTRLAITVSSAVLLALALPRFDFVWLAPFCLVPALLAAAWEQDAKRRALQGWAAGFVYWFGVCYWIGGVLENYAGLSLPVAWLTFFLFCAIKALHWALFQWLAGYLLRVRHSMPLVAALWVGVEHTQQYTGFTWLALGNAGIDLSALMRLAPYTGVHGLSLAFAMMNTAVALLLRRRPRIELAPLLLLLAVFLLPPMPEWRPGARPAVVVQPNVDERDEWPASHTKATIRKLVSVSLEQALAEGQPPALVIWPEVPAPFYFENDPFFRDQTMQLASLARSDFLFGATAFAPSGAPLNSAFLVGRDGSPAGRYDKVRLVPFGEFVPPPFGFIRKISSEAGDFQPGAQQVVLAGAELRLGVFICYESVFGDFVRKLPAQGASVLINLSNDGYFGKSAAREQHLLLARMRAAENRRWLIRATNTGITATIDPAGRIASRLPPFQLTAGRVTFTPMEELTFYSLYGDWLAWLCLIAGAGGAMLRVRE